MRRVDAIKFADAPTPGWYPDPAGRTRLRWWDGDDWTGDYRAPPTTHELEQYTARLRAGPGAMTSTLGAVGRAVMPSGAPSLTDAQAVAARRRETEEVVSEVRKVARSEIDRAIDRVAEQARFTTRQMQPLVSEYTNKIIRFLRRAVIIAFVIVVAWFVFQAIAQQSFLDWVGDRIDNITDDE